MKWDPPAYPWTEPGRMDAVVAYHRWFNFLTMWEAIGREYSKASRSFAWAGQCASTDREAIIAVAFDALLTGSNRPGSDYRAVLIKEGVRLTRHEQAMVVELARGMSTSEGISDEAERERRVAGVLERIRAKQKAALE